MEKGNTIIEPEKYLVEFGRRSSAAYWILLVLGTVIFIFFILCSAILIPHLFDEGEWSDKIKAMFSLLFLGLIGLGWIYGSRHAIQTLKNQ